MNLTFDPDTHEYRWNGVIVPSVTQILNRVGVKKDDDGPFKSFGQGEFFQADENAARFGNALHAVAKYEMLGQGCEYDPALQPWVNGLEMFITEHQWLKKEERRLYVIDYKTSDAAQKHWNYQTAGYDLLVRQGNQEWIDDAVFLVEQPMYHETMKYAGTPDLVAGNILASPSLRSRWTVRIKEDGYDISKRMGSDTVDFIIFTSLLNIYQSA
jgi:hypothetical protein